MGVIGVVVEQKVIGMTGDEAIAYAVKQVEPHVVAAYPITPQTIIVERFSEYVADGEVRTEFVPVESEHSALSACVGAAATGARAFTATASQGLALMWEILYVASGLRLPIVMAIVNRALSAPINIHCDHSDTMGARDSGWIQLYCENSQEAYDTTIQAWRIAEHPDVRLPVMVNIDGFVLSHTLEDVRVLPDEVVKKFVGEPSVPKVRIEVPADGGGTKVVEVDYKLDPWAPYPLTMGAFAMYDSYFEYKRQQEEAMKAALRVVEEVGREYGELTGRYYGLIHTHQIEDADVVVVGLGSAMGTASVAVDELRREGHKVGLLRIRCFRPFPAEKIREALRGVKAVAIMDRAMSFGGPGGPVYTEIAAALYTERERPLLVNYIYGLGGRDISVADFKKVLLETLEVAEKGEVVEHMRYVGLRG
ncbi:pyruvate ferredoxin oxidoreductase [Candidatus Bathyarchaeota archaeon]|nr:MAG: pyruvate ferredoxin oxidoreductase [Candidatus Bathyarchaeota archaeon]